MAWCQAHRPFIVHKTNNYTSISIHTFARYAKEVSGYEVMLWFSVSSKNNFALHRTGRHFFEAITNTSSDAESHEEQNGASHFLIGAMTAKLWPLF